LGRAPSPFTLEDVLSARVPILSNGDPFLFAVPDVLYAVEENLFAVLEKVFARVVILFGAADNLFARVVILFAVPDVLYAVVENLFAAEEKRVAVEEKRDNQAPRRPTGPHLLHHFGPRKQAPPTGTATNDLPRVGRLLPRRGECIFHAPREPERDRALNSLTLKQIQTLMLRLVLRCVLTAKRLLSPVGDFPGSRALLESSLA
jgi:hypothetical protein